LEEEMAAIYKRIIKGGLVVSGRHIKKQDIAINNDKIVKIAPGMRDSDAQDIIDAAGKYVLPGAIDVHVHPGILDPEVQLPISTYVDSLENCSIVGACGGTTTMIYYIHAKPGRELVENIKRVVDEGMATSHTDFAIHGSMLNTKEQIKDISKCVEMGVASFKMFMTYAKQDMMTDDYYLAKAMDVISDCGGLAMVHGEDGLAIDYLEDKYMDFPQKEVFLKQRPDALEADAVFRAISIAEVMNCPLYIAHISAGRVMDPIRWAKEKGQTVYAETCPHYLTLTDKDLQKNGPLAKIGPPLRTSHDIDVLWKSVKDGLIDVIATDHAAKDKRIDEDFFKAGFGAPGAENLLTVTYQKSVNEGRVDLCTLVRALSETPAKIFGLYPQKGILQEGSDADIVLFDPTRKHTVTQKTQHSNASYTLYEGLECCGAPVLTMQRGEILVDELEIKSTKGRGVFLPIKTQK